MCYLCFDIALVFDGLRERSQVRWRFGDEMSDAFEVSWSRMGVDVHVHVHKSLASNRKEAAVITWMNATPVGSLDEDEGL
jgi:hypothetical protein